MGYEQELNLMDICDKVNIANLMQSCLAIRCNQDRKQLNKIEDSCER